jgi:ribosomal protein L9
MKPSSKTPYEIRLELLQLAQVILSERHKAENGGKLFSAPTTEEIIAEADKMNEFISKSNH